MYLWLPVAAQWSAVASGSSIQFSRHLQREQRYMSTISWTGYSRYFLMLPVIFMLTPPIRCCLINKNCGGSLEGPVHIINNSANLYMYQIRVANSFVSCVHDQHTDFSLLRYIFHCIYVDFSTLLVYPPPFAVWHTPKVTVIGMLEGQTE